MRHQFKVPDQLYTHIIAILTSILDMENARLNPAGQEDRIVKALQPDKASGIVLFE